MSGKDKPECPIPFRRHLSRVSGFRVLGMSGVLSKPLPVPHGVFWILQVR